MLPKDHLAKGGKFRQSSFVGGSVYRMKGVKLNTPNDQGSGQPAPAAEPLIITASLTLPTQEEIKKLTLDEATALQTRIASAFNDIKAIKDPSFEDVDKIDALVAAANELTANINKAKSVATASLDTVDPDPTDSKEDDDKDAAPVNPDGTPVTPVADPATPAAPGTTEPPKVDDAPEGVTSGGAPDPEGVPAATPSEPGTPAATPDQGEGVAVAAAPIVYTAAANSLHVAQGDQVDRAQLGDLFQTKIKTVGSSFVASQIKQVPLAGFNGDAAHNTELMLAIPTPGREDQRSPLIKQFGMENRIPNANTFVSAWGCTPYDVLRQMQSCNQSGRTLKSRFRQISDPKLNPLLLSKGTINSGSVSVRTSASAAIDPADSSTWKAAPAWTCGAQRQVVQNEIITAMTITEQEDFNNSEAVADGIETLNRKAEVKAESLLLDQLDATLSHYSLSQHSIGGANLAKGVAGGIYQILNNANYTNVDNYEIAIDAGLIQLLIGEELSRGFRFQDAQEAAKDIFSAFGLDVVTLIGGADSTQSITSLPTVGGGATAIPTYTQYAPTAWAVRIYNADNYAVIDHPDNNYEAGSVVQDLDLLRQNRRAIFGRQYEGLADIGQCAGIRIDVSTCINGNRRIADGSPDCTSGASS